MAGKTTLGSIGARVMMTHLHCMSQAYTAEGMAAPFRSWWHCAAGWRRPARLTRHRPAQEQGGMRRDGVDGIVFWNVTGRFTQSLHSGRDGRAVSEPAE